MTFEEREINKSPLSATELDALIGKRNYLEFLNTRNELYRERNMKDKPPSRAEASCATITVERAFEIPAALPATRRISRCIFVRRQHQDDRHCRWRCQ